MSFSESFVSQNEADFSLDGLNNTSNPFNSFRSDFSLNSVKLRTHAISQQLLPDEAPSIHIQAKKGGKFIVKGRNQKINGTSGDDIIDGRRGTGNNKLNGKDGDDEIFAGRKDKVSGGKGNDTLDAWQGKGENLLKGDKGDDILFAGRRDKALGGAGNDVLWAKNNSSRLFGGKGKDQFWIPEGFNINILDFQVGVDVIGIIDTSGIEQFDDLVVSQNNSDTVIKSNGKIVATLSQISSDSLDQNDFTFVQSQGEALEITFNEDLDKNGIIGSSNPTFNLAVNYEGYEQLIKETRSDLSLSYRYDTDDDGTDDYEIDVIFEDSDTGFYAVGFTSISGNEPPILVVRGTNAGKGGEEALLDVLDDANPKGIGYDQFSANKNEVEAWLKSISQNGKKNPQLSLPIITGESLGGAIAQFIAASYTQTDGKLSQVVTFNSPGISDDFTSLFRADNVGKVTHIVAHGDIVSLAGQEYLPGEYWLLDWDTVNKDVISILPYILDKHNQDSDDLIGNSSISFKTQLQADDLSNSLFSYWTHTGVSGAARRDWALLNLELGILSGGAIPPILSNRGLAEFSRATLGTLLREALENRSDSIMAETILAASHAVDVLGDVLVDSLEHWNDEMWASVAKWSPELWTAIEVSGLPAISFLAVGGVAAAEALASGGLLAATSLLAGQAEAFEALIAGGAKALKALATGDGTLAWEALSNGGKTAWDALKNRGAQGWDELIQGGETAWKALTTNGQDAWNSLLNGGEKAWDAIASGIASKSFVLDGVEYFQKLTSFGDVFEQLELFANGKRIETFFKDGTSYLRNTFIDGVNTLREEWLSGGKKLETFFQNGTSYLRNTFIDGVNTLREEWLSGGKKLETFFKDGTSYLRNTFINGVNTLREEWLGGGKKLETFFQNGTSYLRNTFIDGVNTLREEWLGGGKKLETFFKDGTSYLRNTFIDGVNTLREEWPSGGKKLETFFQNGTSYLRNTFINDVNTFREEWLSGGKKLETTFKDGASYLRNTFINGVNTFREEWRAGGKYVKNYFEQGKNTLRQTFQNGKEVLRQTWETSGNYVEYAWDSAGNFLGKKVFDAAGQLIDSVSNTVNNWIDTVKSWF